jgi:hypothetical protein
VKHQFYFLMKQTLNLFLLKNNMSVSLCPAFHTAPFSPKQDAYFVEKKFFKKSSGIGCSNSTYKE